MKSFPWIPAILLIVAVGLASRFVANFFDFAYLADSSTIYVETGLLAIAMTFVIVSGNIDLSVGSTLVLTACLTALVAAKEANPWFVLIFALGTGMILGLLNGILVAKLKLPSFLVTLATMALYRGAAQAILGPNSAKLPRSLVGLDQAKILGVPWPTIVFVILILLLGLVLHRTVFGRWCFATGSNETAAHYSGVPIDRVKIGIFTLAGFMAGLGALFLVSRLGVARHDLARGIELDAITIVVLGGASIRGGKGTMLGTLLAFLLLMTFKIAMGVSNVKAEYQLTAIGALLILAVAADEAGRSLNLRRKRA